MPTIVNTRHAHADIDAAGVATLTLTDAKSMNILGTPAILEMTAALEQLRTRDDMRVLVLRGSGDRAFIGGADIHEMADLTPPTAEAFITRLKHLCEAVHAFPAPVIARLPGWTLGGGLEVAMACDLRIAAEGAHFGMPEVAVGVPSVIHAVLLPRLIGGARSAWMLMTGESIDAATALDWGLVHEVHTIEAMDARIAALAAKLAGFGAAVMRQQKMLMHSWESMTPQEAIEATVPQFGRAFATGEPKRYMDAFRNRKR
jgi:enoyl-CoA hydratase